MIQSLPTLNSLRAFEAAARHLSFSKAAEELHVTAAAVSQQVRALEEHLGVQLFHRLNRGLALTSGGLAGLPLLQKAFCTLVKGVDRLRDSREPELLAVESAPSFAAKWLLPRMPGFSAEHPDIDLRIAGSLDRVRDSFRSGEINVGIRFGSGDYYLVALEEAADQPAVCLFRDWVLREAANFLDEFPQSITGGEGLVLYSV